VKLVDKTMDRPLNFGRRINGRSEKIYVRSRGLYLDKTAENPWGPKNYWISDLCFRTQKLVLRILVFGHEEEHLRVTVPADCSSLLRHLDVGYSIFSDTIGAF